MSSRDVFIFFSKFGPVNFAKVYQGKQGNYQFAFVTFDSRETRETVLKAGEADLTLRNGRKLKVGAARRRENIPAEIPSRTWVRRKRFTQPTQAVQAVPGQYDDGAHHYQLPPADLQVNLPAPKDGMSPLVPQYLPFNNNITEEQLFFNHVAYPTTTNQELFNSIVNNQPTGYQNQMFNSVTYNNPINQGIFLVYSHPINQEFFNSAVYYHPVGVMPQYQQQFPQNEVENPGNHVQNETN